MNENDDKMRRAQEASALNEGQYRALIAYMQYWPRRMPAFNLDKAIEDIGVTATREQVINELHKAGWRYEEPTGILRYQG